MTKAEWQEQVRKAFGLDQGIGDELDFEYVANFWSKYGRDYCYEFSSVGHGLVWALRSGRFSGVLVAWLRQQQGEDLAELLAELIAGCDHSRASQGVVQFAWDNWEPRAQAAIG